MAKQNSVNLDITNNADGFSIAGGSTSRTLGVSGADITLVGSGTATLTFPTTSTTIAGLGIAQIFTQQQTFNAGITAAGATLTGALNLINTLLINGAQGSNGQVLTSTGTGITWTTPSVSGGSSGVSSFNGLTGAVEGVSSINGATGAITNVARINEGNTFTVRQVMNAGLSAAAASYTLDIIETTDGAGLRIAKGTSSINARTGGIRLGRSPTVSFNSYIENSAGVFRVYNGIGSTGTVLLEMTSLGAIFPVAINSSNIDLCTFSQGFCGSGDITLTGDGLSNATIKAIGANTFVLNASPASGVIKTGVNTSQFVPFGDDTTDLGTSSAKWKSINAQAAIITGGITGGTYMSSEGGYRITSNAIRSLTGTTYTFLTTDDGKIITSSNSSNQIFTIPTGLPVGFNCTVIQLGNAPVGFLGASGVTLNSFAGKTFTAGPHAAVSIIEYATNIVNISGGLTA